jgi:Smg protein
VYHLPLAACIAARRESLEMKETMLDVLMYLFENYLEDEIEVNSDQEKLRAALCDAGFPQEEIGKAFQWLESLADDEEFIAAQAGSCSSNVRVYIDDELDRMDVECRGFLLFLEQAGVLDAQTRELVVDRVMALEADGIDLEQLKWVVLMVLFNRPGKEDVYAWMEDLVFDRTGGRLH